MEWINLPTLLSCNEEVNEPNAICLARFCWDYEDKDQYPDICGLKVCIKKFCYWNFG